MRLSSEHIIRQSNVKSGKYVITSHVWEFVMLNMNVKTNREENMVVIYLLVLYGINNLKKKV